jgi:purine-binding chemotaxis protein CheW
MAIKIDKEEWGEPQIPLADGLLDGLFSELLASAEPSWLAHESGVEALSVEMPTLPPAPLESFAAEPFVYLQSDETSAEETLAALSNISQPVAALEPTPEPVSVAEEVAEQVVEPPPADGGSGREVESTADFAPLEPQAFAIPVPESLPVAASARGLEPEPKPVVLEPCEPKAPRASEPKPLSVESGEPIPAAAPSTGLETLIAAIDSEVAAGPRLTFDTSVDSASSAAVEKKNCIVFSLEGTRYAVSINNVIEMDKIPRITPVPNVPAFVRGVTNLRGEIVSVLDLRVLLGLSHAEQLDRGRILVVRAAGGQQTAALVVDEVRGIATIPLGRLKPPAGTIEDKVLPLLSGVCEYDDTLLNVLSLESLFRSPEIHQLDAN